MAEKENRGLNPIIRSFITFVLLIASCGLLYNVFTEVIETRELKEEIAQGTIENQELTKKKENLKIQKENLNDPKYLIHYARAKYFATKGDGEQVFKLPEESK